jgi:hypothetical protein
VSCHMVKSPSHQLHKRSWYQAEKAGKALAKWLNTPESGHTFKWLMDSGTGRSLVQELLIDALVVFTRLAKYKTAKQFNDARKSKKVPPEFWKSYERLNETLGTFSHVPRIEFDAAYEGELVSRKITNDSPIAHVSEQVSWLLHVIGQGAVLNIRRCECEQCENWFFARVSHQTFCTRSCQMKDFSQTEDFKVKRRKYMHKRRLEERNS